MVLKNHWSYRKTIKVVPLNRALEKTHFLSFFWKMSIFSHAISWDNFYSFAIASTVLKNHLPELNWTLVTLQTMTVGQRETMRSPGRFLFLIFFFYSFLIEICLEWAHPFLPSQQYPRAIWSPRQHVLYYVSYISESFPFYSYTGYLLTVSFISWLPYGPSPFYLFLVLLYIF